MIFLTVGSQLPFDRLVKSVDEWAAKHPDVKIFGQIGSGEYQPKHFEYQHSLAPEAYQSYFDDAQLVISHVGMGTIITALDSGKPLLLMPRLHRFGEHRNDHQLDTAKQFSNISFIKIISDEQLFADSLDQLLAQLANEQNTEKVELAVSAELVDTISQFIQNA